MAKTVVTAFAFAAVLILSAAAFSPGSVAGSKGCAPAYGVDPCTLQAGK